MPSLQITTSGVDPEFGKGLALCWRAKKKEKGSSNITSSCSVPNIYKALIYNFLFKVHCLMNRLESFMLQNLPIMLLSISQFSTYYMLPFFKYALCFCIFHFFSLFLCKMLFLGLLMITKVSQHQVIDTCTNPQGVLIQDLENEHTCRISEQGSQYLHLYNQHCMPWLS